jgi:hypothetical protein
VDERPLIIPITTMARPQQRRARLRDLFQRTEDVSIAHGSRRPSLDSPWVAREDTDGLREPPM